MNKRARRVRAIGNVTWIDLVQLGQTCRYCGIGLEPMHGTYDHVVSLDRGGANTRENLARCCITCQRKKATRSTEEFIQSMNLVVTCALPGCGKEFTPRYSEWKRGMARFCSLSHAARSRWVDAT